MHGAELKGGGITHENISSFFQMVSELDKKSTTRGEPDLDLWIEIEPQKHYDVITNAALMSDADLIVTEALERGDDPWEVASFSNVITAVSPSMCVELLKLENNFIVIEAAAERAQRLKLETARPALERLVATKIPKGKIDQHIRAAARELAALDH